MDRDYMDRVAIDQLLENYVQFYSRLDVPAVAQIWRDLDRNELARAFSTLSRQEVTFLDCQTALRGTHATVNCSGTMHYVPRVGRAATRARAMTWVIELSRTDERWLIDRVTAR